MEQQYLCPTCGRLERYIAGMKHCPHCGGDLPESIPVVDYTCPACGVHHVDETRLGTYNYCINCGARL